MGLNTLSLLHETSASIPNCDELPPCKSDWAECPPKEGIPFLLTACGTKTVQI